MLHLAGCLLTIFAPTLVLLAWQGVSDFMQGPAGCLPTVPTPTLLTASQWFHARSSWVPSNCSHSQCVDSQWVISCQVQLDAFWLSSLPLCWQPVSDFMPGPAGCLPTVLTPTGPVGLTGCEWFHARSSWEFLLTILTPTLVLLSWQAVSNLMPGPAECLLTVLTLTLVLLAWQFVSGFMLGPSGCLLTVLNPSLVLLAWKFVSDSMPGPAGYIVTVLTLYGPVGLIASEWFHARSGWVPSNCFHSHFGPIGLTASEWFHTRSSWMPSDCPHSCLALLTWWGVSDILSGPAGHLLTMLTPNQILLVWQAVRDFMSVPSDCPHTQSGPVGLTESEWFHARSS